MGSERPATADNRPVLHGDCPFLTKMNYARARVAKDGNLHNEKGSPSRRLNLRSIGAGCPLAVEASSCPSTQCTPAPSPAGLRLWPRQAPAQQEGTRRAAPGPRPMRSSLTRLSGGMFRPMLASGELMVKNTIRMRDQPDYRPTACCAQPVVRQSQATARGPWSRAP